MALKTYILNLLVTFFFEDLLEKILHPDEIVVSKAQDEEDVLVFQGQRYGLLSEDSDLQNVVLLASLATLLVLLATLLVAALGSCYKLFKTSAALKRHCQDKDQAIQEGELKVKSLDLESEAMLRQIEALQQELGVSLKEVNCTKEFMTNEVTALQQEMEGVAAERDHLREEVQKLRDGEAEKERAIKELEGTNNAHLVVLQESEQKWSKIFNAKEKETEKKDHFFAEQSKKIKELELKLEEAKKEFNNKLVETNNMADSLEELNCTKDLLTRKVTALQQEMASVTAECNQLNQKLHESKEELLNMEKEKQSTLDKHRKHTAGLNAGNQRLSLELKRIRRVIAHEQVMKEQHPKPLTKERAEDMEAISQKEADHKPEREQEQNMISEEEQQQKAMFQKAKETLGVDATRASQELTKALEFGSFDQLLNTEIFYHRAVAFARLKMFDESVKDCSSALSQGQTNQEIKEASLIVRAYCYTILSKYDEASSDFEALASHNHKDAPKYFSRLKVIKNNSVLVKNTENNLETLGLTTDATAMDIRKSFESLYDENLQDENSACGKKKLIGIQIAFEKLQKSESYNTRIKNIDVIKSSLLNMLQEEIPLLKQ